MLIALMASPAVSATVACAQPTTTTISPKADSARGPRRIDSSPLRRRRNGKNRFSLGAIEYLRTGRDRVSPRRREDIGNPVGSVVWSSVAGALALQRGRYATWPSLRRAFHVFPEGNCAVTVMSPDDQVARGNPHIGVT